MKKNLIYTLVIVIYFSFFKTTLAFDYVMLEKLPGIGGTEGKITDFGTYLSQMFNLSIGIAAILAIFMLAFAGFKYVSVESFVGKQGAKDMMQNAVFGLILILSAFLLLKTINPELVEKEYNIPKVTPTIVEYADSSGSNTYEEDTDGICEEREGLFLTVESDGRCVYSYDIGFDDSEEDIGSDFGLDEDD